MKHGCMVMTLRLSSSRRIGSRQIHRGRKKLVKFAAMSSPCWFFFDIQGIVHKEFVPSGQTVNGKFYYEILKWLMEGIRRKRPDQWKKNNWFLHHDNVPAHTSLVVRQFLTFKTLQWFPTPSLFACPRLLRLFPILQDEITAERASLWHDWGDPRRNARGYRYTHIWELPGMHEIMGNMRGSLYGGDGGN